MDKPTTNNNKATDNYGLILPEAGDVFNIDHFNYNAEVADAAMKSNADNIATNAANIETNTSQIAENSANISSNATKIENLEAADSTISSTVTEYYISNAKAIAADRERLSALESGMTDLESSMTALEETKADTEHTHSSEDVTHTLPDLTVYDDYRAYTKTVKASINYIILALNGILTSIQESDDEGNTELITTNIRSELEELQTTVEELQTTVETVNSTLSTYTSYDFSNFASFISTSSSLSSSSIYYCNGKMFGTVIFSNSTAASAGKLQVFTIKSGLRPKWNRAGIETGMLTNSQSSSTQ